MNEAPIPKLDPERLKVERHDVDLGSEAENAGHDHVAREPGKPPTGDDVLAEPTAGAVPPAR